MMQRCHLGLGGRSVARIWTKVYTLAGSRVSGGPVRAYLTEGTRSRQLVSGIGEEYNADI
jgi:hypothetical protein